MRQLLLATICAIALGCGTAHSEIDITPPYKEWTYMFFRNIEGGWTARLIEVPFEPGQKVTACFQMPDEDATADCFYVYNEERDPDEKDVRNIGGYMHHINLYFEDIVI
jgi:hypothetical protein